MPASGAPISVLFLRCLVLLVMSLNIPVSASCDSCCVLPLMLLSLPCGCWFGTDPGGCTLLRRRHPQMHIANWLSLAQNCRRYFGNQQLESVQQRFMFQTKEAKKNGHFALKPHPKKRPFKGHNACNHNCKNTHCKLAVLGTELWRIFWESTTDLCATTVLVPQKPPKRS